MSPWIHASAPTIDDFARIADEAYAGLPDAFRRAVGDVIFRVADFADDETLDELGIEDPFDLTGHYHGVDLTRRSVLDPEPHASVVFLYRRPILDEWAARADVSLSELIAHVLIHEIGHHFGLSDDDIDRIEESAD